MRRRFGFIVAAVFALLMTSVPAQVMPHIRLPSLPPEVAFAAAPQSATLGELPDRRTRFSKTSRNPNGTYTTTVSSAPLNYHDPRGKWQPIDSHLVTTTQGGYAWRSSANSFATLFKKDLSQDFLRVDIDGKSFALSLDGASDNPAVMDGSSITYRQAFPGVDLRYDLIGAGAKETLVLNNASAPTHYRFYLSPPTKTPVSVRPGQNGSWVVLMPPQHGPVLVVQAPSIIEAATSPSAVLEADPHHAALAMTRAGDQYAVDLTIDSAWLHAASRHFPVRVDPTITLQPDSEETYFHGNVGTDTGQLGTGTYLHIGDSSGHYDWGALQFDLSAIPAGSQITNAALGIYYDAHYIGGTTPDGNGTTHTLEAHRMTAAWTPSSTTSTLAFDPTVLSSLTMTIDGNKRWLNWDVTPAAQNWFLGTQPNYGLVVKRNPDVLNASGPAPLSDNYTSEATLHPKLDITYSSDGVQLYQPITLHSNGAELSWTKYTGAVSGAPFAKYEVHRSAAANFSPSSLTLLDTITDSNQTTFRDTTAAANATFYYKVVANSTASNQVKVVLPTDGQASKLWQPGTNQSQDTYVSYYSTLTNCANYGANNDMSVGTDTNSISRGLFFYPLNDIPTGSTITRATLSLWHYNSLGTAQTVEAHRVTHSWSEGTGISNPAKCTGDGATWYESTGGVKWASTGGDFNSTVSGSVAIAAGEAAQWHNFDITSIAQQWVNGTSPNLGVLLKYNNEAIVSGDEVDYYTNNNTSTPTLRPKLTVSYSDGSHAIPPTVAVASPAPGAMVSGSSVALTASASDDRRVDKVEFYVDGGLVGSSMASPFSLIWNSTSATNAAHTVTAKAYDDAGNAATSAGVSVSVNNNPPPTTSVTSPGATVTGTVGVNATGAAATGLSVSRVEFYADDALFGTATTAPYGASWNTLDSTQPAFDGSHTLTSKVYDSSGLATTSAAVTTSVANTANTEYKAAIVSNTNVPLAMVYDPTLGTQATYPVKVTVTNNSALTWSNANTYLRYRWYSPDATPVLTDGANVALPSSIGPNTSSSQIQLSVTPPTLPDGVDAAQYKLRIDLVDSANNVLFSDKGNQPLDNPVIINKALKAALGLEKYYQYVQGKVGAGMESLVNVANGNSLVHWMPFDDPGRGLATVMDLTYNSQEEHSDSPAGSNFSLSLSTLSRFGEPIDVHPNDADSISGRSNRWIQFIDGDGTPHKFIGNQAADGTIYWSEPSGVHLYLRQYSTTDTSRWWAFTRPDRVTFFYNQAGYPTYVADRNGNTISFTLTSVAPADDPGGPKFHITQVVDAAGQGTTPAPNRIFNIAYYVKADKVKSHVRGRIKSVTDHVGHELDFFYYDDGNLLKITQGGGTNADGSFLASRSFIYTYTTSSGSGAAITDPTARANPDAKTPNESTRLYSVRDPNGHETTYSYITSGQDKWKLLTLTDRASTTTNFSYDDTNLITTVAAPTLAGQTARTTKYAYDANGKPVTVTDPIGQQTTLQWTADFAVSQVTLANGSVTKYSYDNNGDLTDKYDGLNHHTSLTYQNVAVDANDTTGKWAAGRTIPHISQMATKTDPKGFQWAFGYDPSGNPLTVTDPQQGVSTNTFNSDGTLASSKDANGHLTTFATYDANGMATKVIDASDNPSSPTHPATFGNNDDGLLLWIQDPQHAASSGTDPRQYRIYFDYDSFNRKGRQSQPLLTGDTSHLIWTDTQYDANDNVIGEIAPHYGASDTLNGPKTTTSYDAMDRKIQVVVPDVQPSYPNGEQTQYQYDVAGRLSQVTLPKGVLTSNTSNDFSTVNEYDALDRVIRAKRYLVDGSGNITDTLIAHTCYDKVSNPVWTVPPQAKLATVDCTAATAPSAATVTTYDLDNRPLTVTDPLGHETSKTYDADGNVATTTDANANASTNAYSTSYTYDKMNRIVEVDQPFDVSASPIRYVKSRIEYDAVGNKKRVISPRAYDASSDKVTFTNYVTSYQYDALNRLTRTDLPVDGTNPTQLYAHNAYDVNGNLTMASVPVTTSDPAQVTPDKKTANTYFDTGWIRTSKDPANPMVHFEYEPQGWQKSRISETPSGTLDTGHGMFWSYFADGKLQSRTDSGGQQVTYQYDANDNLAQTHNATGLTVKTQAPVDNTVTVDGLDRLVRLDQKKATDVNYTFSAFKYDYNNNLIHSDQNGVEATIGASTPVTAPRPLDYTYDAANWLTDQYDYGTSSAASDDQHFVTQFTPNQQERHREVWGRDASANWQKKQVTDWSYYGNGKLQTLKTVNGSGTTIESHTVGYYDASGIYVDGNRTQDVFTKQAPAGTTAPCWSSSCTARYAYDPRDRAVHVEDGPGTITDYTLDNSGNISQEKIARAGNTTTLNYDYTGNQVQDIKDAGGTVLKKYWYYPEGNLQCITAAASTTNADCQYSDSSTSWSANLQQWYHYDYLNRMDSYRAFGGSPSAKTDTADYVYDAFDRVVSESETHGTATRSTAFNYLGVTNRLTEEQQTNSVTPNTTKDYTYDAYGQQLTMTNSPSGQSAQTYSYGYDVHGSISTLLDAGGNVNASYGYRAYGDPDQDLSQGDTSKTDPRNPFRFSAKRFDSGSGSTDMGVRRFGTDANHFLQQDVYHGALQDLGLTLDPLSQNRYALAGGNPLGFKEWDGHRPIPDGGGGAETDANPTAAPTVATNDTNISAQQDILRGNVRAGAEFQSDVRSLLETQYDPSKYDILENKAIRNLKGETIKVNGKIVRPDFQIIDKASGRISAVYEAKTGSIYYLSGPGAKAYFKYEAARTELGYNVDEVRTVYQIREEDIEPGFRLRPGTALKGLADVIIIIGAIDLYFDLQKQFQEQEQAQKKLQWLKQNDPDYYNQLMWEESCKQGLCA